jgi:flagellar basal-body rod protein FlgB
MEVYSLMKMGLDATALRSEAISQNIANAQTPGYKSKYVSFEETLNSQLYSEPSITLKESSATSMRSDGNNVDLEVEKINQASNSLQYNALVTLMNVKLSMAKSIINSN